jgi:hypothetical protein
MNGAIETSGDQRRASVRGIEQIILARIARAELPAGLARGVNPAIHVSEFLSSSVLLNDVLASADAILVTRTAQRRLGAAFSTSATVIVASFRLDGQSIAEVARRRAAREQVGRDVQGEPEASRPRD